MKQLQSNGASSDRSASRIHGTLDVLTPRAKPSRLVPFRDHPITRLLRQVLVAEAHTLLVTFLRSDVLHMEDAAVSIANARKLRVI